MSRELFAFAAVTIYSAISFETLTLYLEYNGKRFTGWFGEKGFAVHAVITVILWTAAACAFLRLQFVSHPRFHNSIILSAAGALAAAAGLAAAVWGFIMLGPARSLGLNFFRDDVPVETGGIYSRLRNPEASGLCWGTAGFAFLTGSVYNLILAALLAALMIPHTVFEDLPLKLQAEN